LERGRDVDKLEDDGQWELARPEESWRLWKFWKSFDFAPGILWDGPVIEWPDWFLSDVGVLNWLNRMVRRDMGLKD